MTTVRLPIGPQHPLLKEPLSLQIDVAGEQISEATVRIGYVHRGIEELTRCRSYVQNVHLIERICGICSHIHSTTYCQAVEALLGIEIPPRAAALRVLLCELERIHSHLLWIGVLGEAIGFTTIFMYAWRDRELVLDIMERLSGGRVSHAANIIGGVRVDLGAEEIALIEQTLDTLETRLSLYRDLMVHDRPFRLRTQGIGRLSLETVQALGIVGPTARATGVDVDMRRDAPYAGYGGLSFRVIVGSEGDVWSRADVRQQEIAQSLSLCRQAIRALPEGDLAVRAPARVPEGEVVTRTEAPRGELIYYVRSDGSDRPARLKIRTPTLPALMSLAGLLRGVQAADLPVVIAGFDLCIACADR
jgi:NADH-quinone oxidoreductase subunit D